VKRKKKQKTHPRKTHQQKNQLPKRKPPRRRKRKRRRRKKRRRRRRKSSPISPALYSTVYRDCIASDRQADTMDISSAQLHMYSLRAS